MVPHNDHKSRGSNTLWPLWALWIAYGAQTYMPADIHMKCILKSFAELELQNSVDSLDFVTLRKTSTESVLFSLIPRVLQSLWAGNGYEDWSHPPFIALSQLT